MLSDVLLHSNKDDENGTTKLAKGHYQQCHQCWDYYIKTAMSLDIIRIQIGPFCATNVKLFRCDSFLFHDTTCAQ